MISITSWNNILGWVKLMGGIEMNKLIFVAMLVLATVGVMACAPAEQPVEEPEAVPEAPQPDRAADEAELTAATVAWDAAYNAGDAAAIAAMMSDDGMLLPPNSEPVSGREAIEAFWQGFIDSSGGSALRLKQLIVDGDMAVKLGEYDVLDAEGEIVDTGKWMEVWTRTEDGWRMTRDIWNSNLPAAAPSG